jgi:hypothetical protein
MNDLFLSIARRLRAQIMRLTRPKSGYFLAGLPRQGAGRPKRSLKPISVKHGYDRGTPIDRYYMDQFLSDHAADIRGICLEVLDSHYTMAFGGSRVTRSDVLDIDTTNTQANIHGDLRQLDVVKDHTYDCFVLTHTLAFIDDHEAAIRESHRMLKPGGVLLFVSKVNGSISPEQTFWRFTPASVRRVFGRSFGETNLAIRTYGNVLSGQSHWVGLAAEELTKEELDFNDPEYPIIVTLRAIKT